MKMNYLKTGNCTFKIRNSLKEQTENIPDGYGVYKIYANSKDGELLYIGKGGTIQNDGSFKKQNLKERINNKQDGVKRQEFFSQKLSEESDISQLFIEWYIIDTKQYIPGYYEAALIQEYYQQHARLPRWNLCF